jgi:macrolide transport system ATP-binding/permease protein
MENLLRDLQFGLRLLWRRPAFTVVAVLSLGLGIGINTAMFSVVNAVLLAPVPIHEPDRLVEIYTSPSTEMPYLTTSWADFQDIRGSADTLSGLAAHGLVKGLFRRGSDRAEIVMGEVVTDNYFDLLGVPPARGRGFLPEENRTELTHPVVVLSHGFWQRRLAGDPAVLGRTIELSGVAYTVVGVAPEGFAGAIPGLAAEFWAPVMMVEKLSFQGIQSQTTSPGNTRIEQRGTRWLFVKGRLAPGRTVEEARAQVAAVVTRLSHEYPDADKDLRATVLPARAVRFHPMIDEYLTPAAWVLMAAVALVLLVACANVANMLLARASTRQREIALRLAIGAGRAQLVRQLLTESLVLAALGCAVGLALAYAADQGLAAAPLNLPIDLAFRFALDWRVLSFAAAASLVTTVVFGLVPALRASRPNLVPALRGEAGATAGTRGLHLRDLLVVGQLALSLVLLVSGALMLRGLSRAHQIRPGYEPDRLAVLAFNLKLNGYSEEQAATFQRRVVERLRGVPGVEHVALVSRAPLSPDVNMEGIRIAGHHDPKDPPTQIDATYVEPDYFAVLGVPLLEGRPFTDADDLKSPKVVVINQAMARKYWPGRSPIGERIYTDGFDQPSHEIVGVVPDYKVRTLGEEPRPYLHFAWRQQQSRATTILARAAGPARPAVGRLRDAVLAMEPALVFSDEGTGEDLLRVTLAPTRAGATLLGAFGGLALLLAAVGLYGVVAYSVAQRTREVGIRMALGAEMNDVLGLVLGRGMRLAAAGIGIGVLAAAAVSRVLSSMLYGVSAIDPLAFGGACAVLLCVALAANLVPARRAARVDPMVALRYE